MWETPSGDLHEPGKFFDSSKMSRKRATSRDSTSHFQHSSQNRVQVVFHIGKLQCSFQDHKRKPKPSCRELVLLQVVPNARSLQHLVLLDAIYLSKHRYLVLLKMPLECQQRHKAFVGAIEYLT